MALTDAVDPAHAPHPTNDSERLLFRQLYETLIRVDCRGHERPGLAASWRLDQSGRTWIVTLRETARFSDGTPVTTSDLLSSWTRPGSADELRPAVRRHVESVVPVNDQVLGITLRNDLAEAPLALADTDLAVAKGGDGARWPLGTRAYRVRRDATRPTERSGHSVITITTAGVDPPSPGARDQPAAIRFVVAPESDPRDLLDQGVDLLVANDPAVLGYAGTLPQFVSAPLAWQRTHVFVSPWRYGGADPPDAPESRAARSLSPAARQALADDAVQAEARGAEGPFWWEGLAECELGVPAASRNGAAQLRAQPASRSSRLVYRQGDGAGQDLAERLIGLAAVAGSEAAATLTALVPEGPSWTLLRSAGLRDEALASALRAGTDSGYILALDRRVVDPCHELRALVDRAGWLSPAVFVPLVDTRVRAIARGGRTGLNLEWDGGLVITGVEGKR